MTRTAILTSATLCLGLFVAQAPAKAQTQEPGALTLCASQQELEQVISSNGSIVPEGCRNATVNRLTSDGGELCLLDLSTSGNGVFDQLRDAALSQQWWIRCADLAAAGS